MNAHSMPFSKIISMDQGAREHYHVPKYQREYTWGKRDWERLVQDIDENDPGYFMGSIICVSDGYADSPGDEIIYEVVDGQQRLATLSLMMMAIYQRLNELREGLDFEDDEERQDFENTLSSLRKKLVKKKRHGDYRSEELGGWIEQSKMCFLRVQPSSQNSNLEDYKYLMGSIGMIKDRPKPRYLGVRSMCKAYRYFQNNIPEDASSLLSLVAKINQLNFVHISVNTQADAFTLFETLNNRGVPLSAIDIIKNKMLAEMEKQHRVNIDASYEKWQEIISSIPDTTDQERFLRHFYNAFRWDPTVRVEGIPRAVKSKIIAIYENLIKSNAQSVFDSLCERASLYGKLLDPEENGFDSQLRGQLIDLARINAAPAYQVLLYLFSLPAETFTETDFLAKAVDLLRRYYVRRNVTDYPAHYSLLYYTKGKPSSFARPKVPRPICAKCKKDLRDYGGYKKYVANGINLSDVWDDVSPVRHHNTKTRAANELPLVIPERVITISGVEHGLVVDPFAGSGTTVVAARSAQMHFVAADCEMEYCRLMSNRVLQSSGEKGKD